ncbi:salicylate synthase [Actinomadura madurae]|uniref:salicylate synthase n=1 Tax=Actinomadura madurae TaxID=1993 RepID=UPI002025D1CA|nr:salicylate synthase [Actinomadura madurae]MCP9976344.1 salicylate synthase [Actinomadura madurae]MCQ0012167.1 salicylate synthase [Actinomadura madurae]MCQ0012541.1 salicylate synthase [Actinomadura madurae]URN03685.1 salicylate synthase [Actinomadura madurae]
MSSGLRTDAKPAELVVEHTSDPLALVARLAGSGLFDDHVIYERPGSWTFAGGVLGEVVLDADTVSTRWPGRPSTARPWTGSPAEALRDAFAEAPLPTWSAYGWIAFEFAASRPTGRIAHVIVPRTEVRIEQGRVTITGTDAPDRIAALLTDTNNHPLGTPSPVDVRVDGDRYRTRVAAAVSEINAGLYQKVIVSRRLDIPYPVDLVSTYVRGRRANTPARSFLLSLSGFQATGFSPEVLASVDGGGRVMTQPLAGTRAFGFGADADARTRHDLETDPKEIYEHAVSVRTSQDELYRVCEPGTVQVTGFMTVKERGSVQHLGSSVSGILAPGRTSWDALDALFPGVTASGIPKPEAIDAITRLEEHRGLYSGAVVTVSHDGSLDAALVLRALYAENGQAWLRAGAGIVSASTPDREYEETCEKLSSIAPYVVPRP